MPSCLDFSASMASRKSLPLALADLSLFSRSSIFFFCSMVASPTPIHTLPMVTGMRISARTRRIQKCCLTSVSLSMWFGILRGGLRLTRLHQFVGGGGFMPDEHDDKFVA